MKTIHVLYGVLLVGGASGPAHAGISAGVGTEYVSWREYDDYANERLLEESGMRTFVDASLSVPVSQHADLRAYGRIYTGDIDYDGQYQDGTPVQTVTEYDGLVGEIGMGYRPGARGEAEPMSFILHAGIERWTRNITGAGGYEEEYQITYLRVGAEQDAPNGGWTARGGVFWPLSVQEDVKIFDGVSLEPKGKISAYIGGGYRFRSGLELGLNYHAYRLGTSDSTLVDENGDGVYDSSVFQPRSELDTYGLYAKFGF